MNERTCTPAPVKYHLPIVPYEPVDMVNRHAAAHGSMEYAQATGHADYNGHWVTVSFKPHAVSGKTWNAEYWWGGRVVLGRGSLDTCLKRATEYYDRGDKGASVSMTLHGEAPESIAEQRELCEAAAYQPGELERDVRRAEWWTPQHDAITEAIGDRRLPYGRVLMVAALGMKPGEDWAEIRNAIVEASRER